MPEFVAAAPVHRHLPPRRPVQGHVVFQGRRRARRAFRHARRGDENHDLLNPDGEAQRRPVAVRVRRHQRVVRRPLRRGGRAGNGPRRRGEAQAGRQAPLDGVGHAAVAVRRRPAAPATPALPPHPAIGRGRAEGRHGLLPAHLVVRVSRRQPEVPVHPVVSAASGEAETEGAVLAAHRVRRQGDAVAVPVRSPAPRS